MAIIYNITFVTSPDDAAEALAFIRMSLLPALLRSGEATHPRLCRVVASEADTLSFPLELHFDSPRTVEHWHTNSLTPILNDMSRRWGERILFFHTLLRPLQLDPDNITTSPSVN